MTAVLRKILSKDPNFAGTPVAPLTPLSVDGPCSKLQAPREKDLEILS